MRPVLSVLAATVLVGVGTAFGGWWMVPVVGAVWGALGFRARYPGLLAALAASVAWAGLLLIGVADARGTTVAAVTAGVLGVPPAVLYLLTLGFAALLAGSAATIGGSVRRAMDRSSGAAPAAPADPPVAMT